MFGYVRPLHPELKRREYDAYQALYCGLCHAMGRRYGLLARFFLNYDFTFLAMLLSAEQAPAQAVRRRCPAHPLYGRPACQGDPGLEAAADASVILTYYKLRDGVRDKSFLTGLPERLLSVLLRPACRKAAALRPAFDALVRDCLAELHALEAQNSPSIDRAADTFARLLQGAALETGDAARDRVTGQILYHVGRWIYLVDAADDRAEDARAGRYNPLAVRFPDNSPEDEAWLRVSLTHSLGLAGAACQLADFGCWGGIVEQIIYLGLPAVEELVFSGQWKRAKKSAGRNAL